MLSLAPALIVLLSLSSATFATRSDGPARHARIIKRSSTSTLCYPSLAKSIDIRSIEDVQTARWLPRVANTTGNPFTAIDLMPDMHTGVKQWRIKAVTNPAAPQGIYTLFSLTSTKNRSRAGCASTNASSLSVSGSTCTSDNTAPAEWAVSCTACDPQGVSASNCQLKSTTTGLCATHISGNTNTEVTMAPCLVSDGDTFPQGWLLSSY